MLKKEGRIEWVDFIRGFTIFLVVFGHVNSGLLKSERFSDYDILLNLIYDFMDNVRMPLFFMVSGFLYYTKVNLSVHDLKRSLLNKFVALGIPYFVFSIFVWMLKFGMGDNVRIPLDWHDLLMLPIEPIGHFWFLYVLFLIFVLSECLDFIFKNKNIVLCIVLAIAIIGWEYRTDVYVLNKTVQMIAFFYIGKMLRVNLDILKNNLFVALCILSYFVLQSLSIYYETTYRGLNFVISICSVFSIIAITMRLRGDGKVYAYFSTIGSITMPIYLLHPSIASAVRMFLLKVGVDNIWLHFVLGVAVTWFMSIAIYRIAKKSKYTDFLFYPGRYLKF